MVGVSSPVFAQQNSAGPNSMLAQADNALLAGKASDAVDYYETALALDPKNVSAYVGLGKSYEKLGLPGKALRFYRQALTLNPNDPGALEAQAMVLLGKGSISRAQSNLDRLRKVCKGDCPAISRLDSAISKAQQKATANSSARTAQRAPGTSKQSSAVQR